MLICDHSVELKGAGRDVNFPATVTTDQTPSALDPKKQEDQEFVL